MKTLTQKQLSELSLNIKKGKYDAYKPLLALLEVGEAGLFTDTELLALATTAKQKADPYQVLMSLTATSNRKLKPKHFTSSRVEGNKQFVIIRKA